MVKQNGGKPQIDEDFMKEIIHRLAHEETGNANGGNTNGSEN